MARQSWAKVQPHLMERLSPLFRQPRIAVSGLFIVAVVVASACAPVLAPFDPLAIDPLDRLQSETALHPFGTDNLGRDVFSRVIHGGRVSLVVGIAVAALTSSLGVLIGLVAGYVRWLDSPLMRLMDGIMAIPTILLVIALVAVSGAGLGTVIIAITVPELPRVARLIRSIVLAVREEPYVEAAVSVGTPALRLMWRHILPNTIAPLVVQATYVCSSAIILESILSFLGAGTPPEIPSWGNIIASGRLYFQVAPGLIFYPAAFLTLTVLAINLLGDGLRDTLDPKVARQM